MADFGAKRCGNPRLRREAWQAGTTSGKFVYAFPYSPKVFPFTLCCCKENGLPRRFAPRHDMQKHAGWQHKPGHCRHTAGKRPCNRSPGASFRAPLAPNALAPAHTSFLLHVIANQCMGALQRVSLCGERSPKGALLPPGLQTAGSMADFGAKRCGNPRLRREAWQAGTTSGKFVYAFPYSPKVFPFTLCCCKENGLPRRFAPRHDMQKHAGWQHKPGHCRHTAGKRPCNRSPGASFRAPLAPNAPAPAILAPWPAVEGGPGPAKNSAPWTHRNVY